MTISSKLTAINNVKQDIKQALIDQGIDMTAVAFTDYADKILDIEGGGGPVDPEPEEWVRPTDWLALPEVLETDRKFVGLYAIYPNSPNYCTIRSTNAITIDWGDGNIQNVAANTTATKTYDYTTISDTTECSRGYRQVIIEVVGQVPATLVEINLNQPYSGQGAFTHYSNWLDINASLTPNNSSRIILYTTTTQTTRHPQLERFNCLYMGHNSAGSYLFADCFRLQSIPILNLPNTTTAFNMFLNCFSLKSIPDFTTTTITNFSNMFSGCYWLKNIPMLNTSNGTTFASMFSSCYSLQTIPLLNTGNGTIFASMFNNCYSLQTIPLLNTGNGLDFNNMFNNCHSLKTLPLLDTAKGTNFQSFLNNARSILSIPPLSLIAGTNFVFMFWNCYSLKYIPDFNTPVANDFQYFCDGCWSLQNAPMLTTTTAVRITNMFNNCYSLQTIPAYNLTGVASSSNASNFVGNCNSLVEVLVSGLRFTHSYANCKLSASALNTIYTNLPTITGQTITVSNNPGISGDDISIATAKGWSVSGS